MKATPVLWVGIGMAALAFSTGAEERVQQAMRIDIESQRLTGALNEWAQQTGFQLISSVPLLTDEHVSPPIKGVLSAEEALTQLLDRTPFTFEYVNDRTVAIRSVRAGELPSAATGFDPSKVFRLASLHPEQSEAKTVEREAAHGNESSGGELSETVGDLSRARGIPEVLVIGSRILNTDIARTRDDAQPYVIFDRETVSRSGSLSVGDFLKDRLPMNAVSVQSSQSGGGFTGNMGQVNLRGLGTNQTLILIDGRRIASSSASGNNLGQPDLNGIPLAAIERIEILPTTASGIYGGSATGGVINIIMRRDYTGAEVELTYDSDFDGAAPTSRVDAAVGFSLPNDKTQVLLSASYSDQGELAVSDRGFLQEGRSRIFENNPSSFTEGFLPPLGATANVRSLDGSPLYGPGTPSFGSVPESYRSSQGIAPLMSGAGVYNLELANSAEVPGGGQTALLNRARITSASATINHEFGSGARAFLDLSAANNVALATVATTFSTFLLPAGVPTNPFGQSVLVTVPVPESTGTMRSEDEARRVTAGASFNVGPDWRAHIDYTWSRSSHYNSIPGGFSPDIQAAIDDGSLDILADSATVDFSPYVNPPTIRGPFETTLNDVMLRFGGTVGTLPAGPVAISALVEYRRETIDDGWQVAPPSTTLLFPNRSQRVTSAYLETNWPLIASETGISGIRSLDLQLAGRWDEYSLNAANGLVVDPTPDSEVRRSATKLSSFNPTVAVRYEPAQGITLRASYGTGFLPPGLEQLVPNPPTSPRTVRDPRRGGSVTTIPAEAVVFGGNPDLRPEDSRSWSAGLVLSPSLLPGFRLSVDFTRIEKTHEIRELSAQQVVDNEDVLSGRVTRGEIPPNDPFEVGPIVGVNSTLLNLAQSRIEAFDFAIDYALATAVGSWGLSLIGTKQTHYETQLLPGSPVVENVGATHRFPLKLRGNAQLRWEFDRWLVSWTTRYFDSYLVALPGSSSGPSMIASQGSTRIASQTYHDLLVEYRFPAASKHASLAQSVLSGLQVRMGAKNIFDEAPPFDVGDFGFYYSLYGDPRLASYYISVKKSF